MSLPDFDFCLTTNPTEELSIYQRALGSDFYRLHPQIQRRFSLTSARREACFCTGTMQRIWRGARWTWPFLQIGTARHILFPEHGENIPFTCENVAYCDPLGRETVSWIRTFTFPGANRRFDAYMVYNEDSHRIVDYLGTHQHLAVDLDISVDPRGGIAISSGEQRFYEGPAAFRFPDALTGRAQVCEWFDDALEQFRIEVRVTNNRFGDLMGYSGTFTAQFQRAETVPNRLLPRRIEARP